MCSDVGDLERRLACDEAIMKAAVYHWRRNLLQHIGAHFRNETEACFLDKTEGTRISSREPSPAVEDRVEYGLQVVWRTSNGAQHCRYGRPLPKDLVQLLLQICAAVSSFGRFAGFE